MAFFLQDKSGDILYFSYWRQIPMKRQKTTTDPTNKYSLWSQSLIHVVAYSSDLRGYPKTIWKT